ncbi:unnamed protein product [Amoebophrya sp. A25]|nr:unnamed protein product [Amoebophrya sp. A25]|eukprot:GSA25T00006204001.1
MSAGEVLWSDVDSEVADLANLHPFVTYAGRDSTAYRRHIIIVAPAFLNDVNERVFVKCLQFATDAIRDWTGAARAFAKKRISSRTSGSTSLSTLVRGAGNGGGDPESPFSTASQKPRTSLEEFLLGDEDLVRKKKGKKYVSTTLGVEAGDDDSDHEDREDVDSSDADTRSGQDATRRGTGIAQGQSPHQAERDCRFVLVYCNTDVAWLRYRNLATYLRGLIPPWCRHFLDHVLVVHSSAAWKLYFASHLLPALLDAATSSASTSPVDGKNNNIQGATSSTDSTDKARRKTGEKPSRSEVVIQNSRLPVAGSTRRAASSTSSASNIFEKDTGGQNVRQKVLLDRVVEYDSLRHLLYDLHPKSAELRTQLLQKIPFFVLRHEADHYNWPPRLGRVFGMPLQRLCAHTAQSDTAETFPTCEFHGLPFVLVQLVREILMRQIQLPGGQHSGQELHQEEASASASSFFLAPRHEIRPFVEELEGGRVNQYIRHESVEVLWGALRLWLNCLPVPLWGFPAWGRMVTELVPRLRDSASPELPLYPRVRLRESEMPAGKNSTSLRFSTALRVSACRGIEEKGPGVGGLLGEDSGAAGSSSRPTGDRGEKDGRLSSDIPVNQFLVTTATVEGSSTAGSANPLLAAVARGKTEELSRRSTAAGRLQRESVRKALATSLAQADHHLNQTHFYPEDDLEGVEEAEEDYEVDYPEQQGGDLWLAAPRASYVSADEVAAEIGLTRPPSDNAEDKEGGSGSGAQRGESPPDASTGESDDILPPLPSPGFFVQSAPAGSNRNYPVRSDNPPT